ncbi:MAG: 23S rRNA (adenine(2503)-C(2))-methyltransferase RlmN, partial [Lachnospiraceae bacterium]|nr:23S rRNA (adenine(2503)-C(2))-methyltransferase RlmN [Lachnospiraceae bacterium]
MKKTDIKSLPFPELEQWVLEQGEPKYRARQLYQWMHQKMAADVAEMSNIPDSLKQKTRTECKYTVLRQAACQVSGQDGTRKYLFRLNDGNMVESVLMKYRHGYSVCVSSQVGCRMGCRFCASTVGGLVRD